jgi:molybdopterin-guanine dinucleotide biosynthesis protein A
VGRRRFAHTAVLLAGGKSTRFGSDKLLAKLAGAPLVVHAVRGALSLFSEVVVVAKEPERYRAVLAACGFSSLLDSTLLLGRDLSRRSTPLAGLEAGLTAAHAEVVFVAAADMPFAASTRLIAALTSALAGHDAAAPRFEGAPQPLCALYRREPCLEAATALLAKRAAGPRALLDSVRTRFIDYESVEPADAQGIPFLDADTPEALAALQRVLP